MKVQIILPGRPITKRNSQRIIFNRKTQRYQIIQSKRYLRYEKDCLRQLKTYRGPRFKEPVHVRALYWMPDKRPWPDLLGLEQATADTLGKSEVIDNDRNIISWDGSKIIGIDKRNPRTVILIEKADRGLEVRE